MSNTYSHMFVCTYYGPVSPFFPSAGHEPLPLRHWTVCFSSPKRWQRAAACTCLHFLGRFEFGENPGNDFDMVWEVPLFKTNPYTVYIYAWLFTVCLSLSLPFIGWQWVASHASYHRQAFICKIPIISAIMLLPYETRTSCSWSWILFNIVSGSFCPCWILSAVLDLFSETTIHLSQWAVPKTPVISIYLVCWCGFHIDTEMNYISHPINNLCSYSIVIPSGCHWLESPCHCSQLSNAQAPLWMDPRRRSLRHWTFRSPRVKRWQHAAHMAP